MTKPTYEQILAVCDRFAFAGAVTDVQTCGNGHINSTYTVTVMGGRRYVLQILNTSVFKDPVGVMENIAAVTDHIRRGLEAAGEDAERGTMRVILTVDGQKGYTDPEGRFWRAYDFVEGTVCRLTLDSPETFARVGEAFGDFQRRLADFDASRLAESIPNFHNTKKRYADFLAAVERNASGRADAAQEEIRFITERADKCALIVDALADGTLPLRVTHNDTKLSNILLDEVTEEAVCVIDLDTVMPGSALYDFGDSIRFGAASAAEDEKDLSKVWCDMELYEAYVKGWMESCGKGMSKAERELLPIGARMMTFECGVRFLTDYLQGDTYFATSRPGQNLDRCRTQLKLVADMEAKAETMRAIVEKYA